MIDLKELSIEKFSLFIVVLFVAFLFADYGFDFVYKIRTEYEINKLARIKNIVSDKKIKDSIDIELTKYSSPTIYLSRKKFTMVLLITIFPLLFFVGKVSFQKMKGNNDSLTVVSAVFPFLMFVGSFYLLTVDWINRYYIWIFIMMLLQLILFISLDGLSDNIISFLTKLFEKKDKGKKSPDNTTLPMK